MFSQCYQGYLGLGPLNGFRGLWFKVPVPMQMIKDKGQKQRA